MQTFQLIIFLIEMRIKTNKEPVIKLTMTNFSNRFCLHFQSKLNCEILHDDLAFEVRWAVAGESIVIQLVAKLGKYEYTVLLNFILTKNLEIF